MADMADGATIMTDELRRELSEITNVQRAAVLMLLLGVFGGIGHYFVARAFTYAQANVVAPFMYWQMIGSVIVMEPTEYQAWLQGGGMEGTLAQRGAKLFNDLAKEPAPASPDKLSLRILIPAFMISELKRAFEIGFLLFLPFLIIDLVVASVTLAVGMVQLPPVMISAPLKVLLFVLVDGWSLIMGSLAASFAMP